MRVLIIGCGYVGLSLGRRLAGLGHQVFGLRRGAGEAARLAEAGVLPLQADITRPDTLPAITQPWDWVVNCVSSSGGGVEEYRGIYCTGAENLCGWLGGAPPHRLVYTSSTGVYGQNDGTWVDEQSPTEPSAETGRVLLEAEQIWLSAAREKRLPAIILRVAGIYGPERGYWLRRFQSGEARLEGDGGRFLNMIHREDAAGAVIAALAGGQPGAIYNAVDDEPVSQRTLFEWLAKRYHRPLPPTVPEEEAGLRKRGVTSKRISNARLRRELGWNLLYPTFRDGFESLPEPA